MCGLYTAFCEWLANRISCSSVVEHCAYEVIRVGIAMVGSSNLSWRTFCNQQSELFAESPLIPSVKAYALNRLKEIGRTSGVLGGDEECV